MNVPAENRWITIGKSKPDGKFPGDYFFLHANARLLLQTPARECAAQIGEVS